MNVSTFPALKSRALIFEQEVCFCLMCTCEARHLKRGKLQKVKPLLQRTEVLWG